MLEELMITLPQLRIASSLLRYFQNYVRHSLDQCCIKCLVWPVTVALICKWSNTWHKYNDRLTRAYYHNRTGLGLERKLGLVLSLQHRLGSLRFMIIMQQYIEQTTRLVELEHSEKTVVK